MVPRVFRIQDGTPDQEGPYVPYVAGRPHASVNIDNINNIISLEITV